MSVTVSGKAFLYLTARLGHTFNRGVNITAPITLQHVKKKLNQLFAFSNSYFFLEGPVRQSTQNMHCEHS